MSSNFWQKPKIIKNVPYCHCEERGTNDAAIPKFKVIKMSYYTYITTNKRKTVLYVGVTNNLTRRINEHKSGQIDGFTKRYNVDILIYAEKYEEIKTAIAREKQIKSWSRTRKEKLIETTNKDWTEIMPF